MNDFVQDMENLINAYDDGWDDYLALCKQLIEKYKLSAEKLQEQLNTAKKALTEISSPNVIGAARIPLYRKIASEALAAIGGDDDENRL
ncbi:prophage pi3 protein 34 [Lactococcus lactis subsp. lactis]|jgi:hypothetical protein|uniref:Prophage pi3 protein 34 n=1 Tax=Lactococcus lactis subsp. lactis TaxID=1360 RepID=A0A0V8CZH7_LACLL|nr:hypothetical protein [Lactococcus lactis]KSU06716.1 prophage pi3 protein 34 [Lactococcus lactis subsp. lactis]